MRLYRFKNKANTGWWVFAESIEEGKQISFDNYRATKLENITFVGDQTDFYRKDTNIDEITVKGIAGLEIGPAPRKWKIPNPIG